MTAEHAARGAGVGRGVCYGSVCSGIEAASVAWHPLGWRAAWLAEIETFPSAVLAHHYPATPNLGDITAADFTERAGALGAIDVLVGGTPCQSFSVAGLRRGLADPRGNLALVFLSIVDRLRPTWVVWENVPGVLSSGDGRDFGAFLGALGELGYGWSYRVLDAQYFGVAQRRRRVFVVGHLGDWRRAAAVLFERDCLSGNPPPRRETGARVADGTDDGTSAFSIMPMNSGRDYVARPTDLAQPLMAGGPVGGNQGGDFLVTGPMTCNGDQHRGIRDVDGLVAHALRADGFDASEDGTGRGTPLTWGFRPNASESDGGVPQRGNYPALRAGDYGAAVAFTNRGHDTGASAETLRAASHGALPMVAYAPPLSGALHTALNTANGNGNDDRIIVEGRTFQGDRVIGDDAVWPTLPARSANNGGGAGAILHRPHDMAVRRLTPMECERLQGFPDGWTDIPYKGKPVADGPRYKALGNSMAVPVMRWIGERIAAVMDVPA